MHPRHISVSGLKLKGRILNAIVHDSEQRLYSIIYSVRFIVIHSFFSASTAVGRHQSFRETTDLHLQL
jgi:hypothetical protein